jgi:hypothetical protein
MFLAIHFITFHSIIQNEMRRKDRIITKKTLWNKRKVVPMLRTVSQMCKEGCAGKEPYILPVALDGNE